MDDTYSYLSRLGATDDQIRRSYARYTQNPVQPQPQQNGWANILPTIGSIAAPVIGAALAPETGGLSLAAAAMLSGAGSAAGKVGQNALQGQDLTSDLGGSFGEGALGGFGGGLAGKALGAVGGKVVGGIRRAADGIASNKSAQAAYDRLSAFSGVPAKVRQANDLNGTADLLDRVGVGQHTPQAYQDIAGAVTGENGAVNGIKRELISKAGPVDMSNILGDVENAIKPNVLLGDVAKKGTTANATRNWIRDELQQNVYGGEGSLSSQGDPNSVFDLIQKVGNLKAELGQGEQADALGKSYDGIKKALESRLYNNAGANKLVSDYQVTPEDMWAINRAAGGNQQLVSHMVNGLNDAKSVSDLRGIEAPFVKANNLGRAADRVAGGEIPTPPTGAAPGVGADAALAMAPATHGFSLAALLPKALKSEGAVTGASQAIQTVSGLADQIPEALKGVFQNGPAQMLTHAGDFSSPQAALPHSAPALPSDPSQALAQTPKPPEEPASGYTDDQLQQALAQDIHATGGKHATQIEAMMRINAAQAKTANPPMSAVTKRQYSQVVSADQRLNDFEGLMSKVVNQSGPGALLTGAARTVGGNLNLDTNAKNFNDIRSEMALSLARALSGGATTGSESMMKRIEGYIPKITDTQESAAAKMQLLHQMLADTKKSMLVSPEMGGSGSTDLSQFSNPQQVSFGQ